MLITVSLSVRSKQNKIYSDIIKIISHSQVMRREKKYAKWGILQSINSPTLKNWIQLNL